MLLRRYGMVFLVGMLCGFVLAAVAVQGGSSGAFDDQSGMRIGFGLAGAAAAAVVQVAAGVAIRVADRRLIRGPGVRIFAAAVGAAAGMLLLGAVVDLGTLLTGGASGDWPFFFTLIAAWAAVPVALAVTMLALWAERRAGAFTPR
jgi:hypothetical protein